MLVDPQEILVALGKTTWTEADRALLTLVHGPAEAALMAWMQQNLEYQLQVEYLPLGNDTRRVDPLADAEFFQWDVSPNGSQAVLSREDNFRATLQLTHTPVWLSGLTVWEDTSANAGQSSSAFAEGTKLNRGSDYWLDIDDHRNQLSSTGLLRRNGAWPEEPRSIKVSYYGGYSAQQLASIAGDIKLAVIEYVCHCFWMMKSQQKTQAGSIRSESIGKYSVGFSGLGGGGMPAIPASIASKLQPRRSYSLM